jgi:5-oxoprolinase (ATP-hydrolysing)
MKWQFWIDRGGTFTDVVALSPQGKIITHKLLSENPEHYQSAPIEGIRRILDIPKDSPIPTGEIEVIKMGTTVATNALLERKGTPVVLVTNQGFKDILRIGYQNRPDIFARHIRLPEMLYKSVIEVSARFSAQGEELHPLNLKKVQQDLEQVYDQGIRSCAIALIHSYRYPDHENAIAEIADKIGFTQISVSHRVSNLIKLVGRGDTTVVDAYLSPILGEYVQKIEANLYHPEQLIPQLMFMQSNGGLADARYFHGKDSILSGPAGGIVGAVKTSQEAGYKKIITFDMGGTSTDVAHFAGEYERQFETEIAGVRMRTPMMSIHTVAAGGGSICYIDSDRYRVGPESAGANPGPACYGKGEDLTVTDCNLLLGKIQPEYFPKVFGKNADQPLNKDIVIQKFNQLKEQLKQQITVEEIAEGFLTIAVEKMANAIKKISLQKGYDLSEYALFCFGGAGGQHACLIAENLGMKTIIIHPLAGVLSAYGIGVSDVRVIKEKTIHQLFSQDIFSKINQEYEQLEKQGIEELKKQTAIAEDSLEIKRKIYLKYQNTDFNLEINYSNYAEIKEQFNQIHKQRYGFIMLEKYLIVDQISVELITSNNPPKSSSNHSPLSKRSKPTINEENDPPKYLLIREIFVDLYSKNKWHQAPVYQREELTTEDVIIGPALIIETTGTNVIEQGWEAKIDRLGNLILTKNKQNNSQFSILNSQFSVDPILLEIFNNLFRFIAEQMGITLQKTSYSVNIKERLDFSCAIFDEKGDLVANAPHIPVHLGSMSESVKALINMIPPTPLTKKGDVYVTNNPYNGGTHLPDITVITPVFIADNDKPDFFVASRGHHADIGGITPGSMPPDSTSIEEEGILLDNMCLVKEGKLREKELNQLLNQATYPVRNYNQNLADLKAQIAANEKGVKELKGLVNKYGLTTIKNYMQFIQDNAEKCVKKAIKFLKNGSYTITLDNQAKIQVTIAISPDQETATIDFTGTSPQLNNNFNTPVAVTKAAVLYVFRTLVEDDIPLNAGCLKPVKIIIPEGCFLNPQYPAPVVAGNVETSQNITDCLYGALGIMANSQGTMNNFTFGNSKYQYYETICGGSGAGINHDGTDAVQVHMTNSRLTDPEVLEQRFPVRLEEFSIRANSGGEGKYQGGNGVVRKIRFLESMTASILSSRRVVAPQGLQGGGDGKRGCNYIIRSDRTREEVASQMTVEMDVDDIFVIETPGGGGFSFPSK